MNVKLSIFTLFILKVILIKAQIQSKDPDEDTSTADLIRNKGYLAEEHDVITKDGFIITIQRVVSPNFKNKSSKPVVFLQHGLLDASSTWVINFPSQSLGFILADKGFDVWLGNTRGNTHALHHTKYNKNEEIFWNFSFDEIALYDLPAMVNYILDKTNQSKLFYVGHSQGNMVAFARLSTCPEFNSKIKLFLALGPAAHLANLISPIKYLAKFGESSQQKIWFLVFGKKDFLPSTQFIRLITDELCSYYVSDTLICENILMLMCGPSKNINESRIPVYFTHTPAGTSTKNMIHFAQIIISKNFQMFDYGDENHKYYNQSTAPIYEIRNVKVPVALYSGQDDWLTVPEDVEYLRKYLPNIVDDYEINDWNHLDFVWAVKGSEALYSRMIQLMFKYI